MRTIFIFSLYSWRWCATNTQTSWLKKKTLKIPNIRELSHFIFFYSSPIKKNSLLNETFTENYSILLHYFIITYITVLLYYYFYYCITLSLLLLLHYFITTLISTFFGGLWLHLSNSLRKITFYQITWFSIERERNFFNQFFLVH